MHLLKKFADKRDESQMKNKIPKASRSQTSELMTILIKKSPIKTNMKQAIIREGYQQSIVFKVLLYSYCEMDVIHDSRCIMCSFPVGKKKKKKGIEYSDRIWETINIVYL